MRAFKSSTAGSAFPTERDFKLHVVEYGGRPWHKRLVFRDLLRRDEGARQIYLEAKLAAARDARGLDDYGHSKAPVVARLLAGTEPE